MIFRRILFLILSIRLLVPAFETTASADTAQILGSKARAFSQEAPRKSEGYLAEAIKTELSRKWPGASIELTGAIRWLKGFSPENQPVTITLQDITPRGEALFLAVDKATGGAATGWVNYAAWVRAYVALRRISIGEKLIPEMWAIQDINAATGSAYEYRGTIINQGVSLAQLESRQTILEGQFLTTSAVQRIPDVRRGDSVRIRMISGGLSISTQGTVEEPGYIQSRIRVMANRNKREFVGQLGADGIVEVKL